MESKQGCLTCKFAVYVKTPTGKLKKGQAVRCLAPEPSKSDIENALRSIVPASMLPHYTAISPWAFGMWPGTGDGGEGCSQWNPIEHDGSTGSG